MTGTTAAERVLLSEIRDGELSVDELLGLVRDPECGGIVTFLGIVRDHDHGEDVAGLDYSAHPTAQERLADVCREVAQAHTDVRLAAVHRVGELKVGDTAVVVVVAAPHRGQAFDACRELIDTLKREVPIWKHQRFTDGRDEWVGTA